MNWAIGIFLGVISVWWIVSVGRTWDVRPGIGNLVGLLIALGLAASAVWVIGS